MGFLFYGFATSKHDTLRGKNMMLTLLTISGVVLSLAAVYVVTEKAKGLVLASDNTVVGLSDSSSDTLATGRHVPQLGRTDWNLATVTALSDAEELLDVLECQGYAERELVVLGNSSFAVRWR